MLNTRLILSNGLQMPLIGLGTWLSKPGEVKAAVAHAIDVGYRHIDCAYLYNNEDEVGEAIQEKIKSGVVRREDLFITTKLWSTFHHAVAEGFAKSLEKLNLSYVDLYLIHIPCAIKDEPYPDNYEIPWEHLYEKTDLVATWKQMEKLVVDGKTRSIGISNFNIRQTQLIIDNCAIRPVMNQFEAHPYNSNEELIKFCKKNHVSVTAYSPLGNPMYKGASSMLNDPVVTKLAKKYAKEPAQILINYHLSQGTVCIPKSVTPARIASNFEATHFKMSDDEIAELKALNRNDRVLNFNHVKTHPEYPF